MPLTLLFDLDNTLLDTNLETFVPEYFKALSEHLAGHVPPDVMLRALVSGTNLMNESQDPGHTLQEVFEAVFYSRIGIPKENLLEVFDDFYEEIFPSLAAHTRRNPEAVSLIEWASACGFRIGIATDPFFPRKATWHRLRWAGLDPERLELVSTFEDFHFTKAHPAYYAEMLGRLGWPEGPVLMVGNDVRRDLLPANRLGLATYLVDGDSASGSGPFDTAQGGFEAGCGKLGDLRPWLESVDLSALEPSFKSPEAVLGIMVSTPAVLNSLCSGLTAEQWRHEPGREDWAMSEIVCHLRDTEREVHGMQFELLLERPDAFIPRPETSVWASERGYLDEDGPSALAEFANARLENLRKLSDLDEQVWSRKARHAIFGPTNFLEIMRFVTDHDRMHTQQAWKTLGGA